MKPLFKSVILTSIQMLSIFQKDKNTLGKSSTANSSSVEVETDSDTVSHNKLIYPKPQILLIDLDNESEKSLSSVGYKIDTGTFGEVYEVEKSSNYKVITLTHKLPNYREQEIIIIDLETSKIKNESSLSEQNLIIGNTYFYAKMNHGIIDTRDSSMYAAQNSFNNIFHHSGIFIIFSDSRSSLETVYAVQGQRGFSEANSNIDNWSFLSVFDEKFFQASFSEGTEIFVANNNSNFYQCLQKHMKGAKYNCTLKPISDYETQYAYHHNHYFDNWIPTASDKYGNSVAGAFTPKKDSKQGWIFVFPQIANKSAFLLEFLRDVLPELTPNLFPYSENKNWLERKEYQPIIVQNLDKEIEEIENEAKLKVEKIKERIQQEKEKIEYQNKLLTDDGDSLVKAIEETFKVLGFTNVINVDEEYKIQRKTSSNDEDLQIRDESTSLLIEIKGVAGHPKDDDVFQVTKHIPIRMKEWKKFDVKALSIINHQKATPALDRDKTPFRQLILDSAVEQNLGLMTTFDLYRLVRSFLKNNWKHKNIKDLFIQSGHFSIVPAHYEYVGVIENYWEKVGAVGIRIEENFIKHGDVVSFELPLEFEEMNVDSLQVENQSVEIAEKSMLAGIKTNLPKENLKKGTKVFRINISTP